MEVKIKRMYEKASPDDGYRVLVDRLWPRGIKKVNAAIDLWAKDIAPSAQLRKWFGHDPAKFEEFKSRYIAELHHNTAFAQLSENLKHYNVITLLYSAKDKEHNNAVVLKSLL